MLKDLATTKKVGYLDFDKCALSLTEEDRLSVEESEIYQQFKHNKLILLAILGELALSRSKNGIVSRISRDFQVNLSAVDLDFYVRAFYSFDPFKTIIANFREKLEEGARFIPVASKAYRLEKIQQEIEHLDEIEDRAVRVSLLNTLLKAAREEEKDHEATKTTAIQNYYTFVQNVDAQARQERGLPERAY